MNENKARKHRFGILAARHCFERWRITAGQADYIEGHEGSGWNWRDSKKAFNRERNAALLRFRQEVARLTPTRKPRS